MTADLGAPRTKEGGEIAFARAYFHAACVAAGVRSIDYPYTYADDEGVRASCAGAKALGIMAKSLVAPGHAKLVNEAFTPTDAEVILAERIVAASRLRGGTDEIEPTSTTTSSRCRPGAMPWHSSRARPR